MDFPHNNWYLHFEEKDRELVDNWRINIIKFSDKPCPGNYINFLGGRSRGIGGGVITIEQFKKYVLNIEEYTQEQNYNYLIPILNKLKQ